MTDTKINDGMRGGFGFRCGGRRWTVHAVNQSQLDPIIGISVYIVDVYTRGQIDEEWLHGRNAKLCRGRAVLADNLVLAAAPLRCRPAMSAFRIRIESIEQVRAPGEIGACSIVPPEELGDGHGDWIDISVTRTAVQPYAPVRSRRPPPSQDRDPTPPPLLLHDPSFREAAFDEQTTVRLQGLTLPRRSSGVLDTDESPSGHRSEHTLEIDHRTYPWPAGVTARASLSDDTQILSRHELEEALGPAPFVRARGEQGPGATVRMTVLVRARR